MNTRWKARLATIVLAGSTAMGGAVATGFGLAFAATNLRSGPVAVAGQTWRNVPYVTAGGTTYFGIWYLQQLLKDYGISTRWDGKTLYLTAFPAVTGSVTGTVNGQTVPSSQLLTAFGQAYVDVTTLLTGVGGTVQYNSASRQLSLSWPTLTQASSAVLRLHSIPSLQLATLTSTSSPTSVETGYVRTDGQLWKSAPIVRRDGTTFFGIWYLQQYLKARGISSTWDGQQLNISTLPKAVTAARVKVGTATQPATLIQFGKHWFVSVASLQAIGVKVDASAANQTVSLQLPATAPTVVSGELVGTDGKLHQGQVAIADASGAVQVVSADASGHFSATVDSVTGAVIGTDEGTDGWVGLAIPFTGSTQDVVAKDQVGVSQIDGKVHFQGAAYPVVLVSIRNVITHAHYYAKVAADGTFTVTVPAGAYEVYALETDTDAVFMAEPFFTTGPTTPLAVTAQALPTDSAYATTHAVITAKDASVTAEQLLSVGNLFEHVYGPTIQATGMKPDGKMQIDLYGTTDGYMKHFTDEGYTQQEAQQITDNSVAAEEGTNSISVLMPVYETVDGMNILAHEFTHALIANTSSNIQSWANEGIAWHNGVAAEVDQSPESLLKQSDQWYEWIDIVDHQKQGDLLPLGQSNPLAGNYNIEAQDYYAVQMLVNQFGMAKLDAYVRAIDTDPNAFVDTFGETFSAFSQQVTAKLKQQAGQTNAAFTVQIRVLPGGPNSLYVVNPAGTTQLVTGLVEGNIYTLTCKVDGTVSASPGLTVGPSSELPVVYSGDWYVGTDLSGTGSRQEFEIEYSYGIPFLVQALLYASDGNVEHAYPATAVPNGLQLVSLKGDASG